MPSSMLSPPYSKSHKARRLSSNTATKEDIASGGPVVVMPQRMILQRAQSHHSTFAEKMETARKELSTMNLEDESSSGATSSPEIPGSPVTPPDMPTADTFAFAFDIDGVLIRGGRPLPEAIEAMKVLNGENEYGIRMYVCPFYTLK